MMSARRTLCACWWSRTRPGLAASLRTGLEAEGFAVDVAPDGGEALWFARENAYDAILLDIMLPVLNGYQVCATLRAEKNWTPILMLTAKDGELGPGRGAGHRRRRLRHQAVLLRRAAGPAPVPAAPRESGAPGRARSVTWCSTPRRDGSRGRRTPTLTSRELVPPGVPDAAAGDVVTKAQILAHVWDFDFEGDPNIVEVYVARLRRKIDKPFDRLTIETLRGSGYRLRAGRASAVARRPAPTSASG